MFLFSIWNWILFSFSRSLSDGNYGKNAIICEADMSLSVQINNDGKDTLTLSFSSTQGLDDTTLATETQY